MGPKKREKEPPLDVYATETNPGKAQPKTGSHAVAGTSSNMQFTTVAAMRGTPATTLHTGKTITQTPVPASQAPNYESPLKKLKKAMSQHPLQLIDTIDGLRDFITNNYMTKPEVRSSIRIQARLLWTTSEKVKGLHFLRLFLGETQAPEPLEQQQQDFQQMQCDDPYEANQYLITTSLLEVDSSNPRVPKPGDVFSFTPFKLRLYRNCCQVDTKLQSITKVTSPPPPLQF